MRSYRVVTIGKQRVLLGVLGLLLALVLFAPAGAFHDPIHDLAVTPPADLTVIGATPAIQLGISVATGDFNGDNIDDLLIGELSNRVYVFFGSATLGSTIDLVTDDPDVAILGAQDDNGVNDGVGISVASGDFNGDNIDDLLFGARGGDGLDNNKPAAGEVYVIFGSTTLSDIIDLGEDANTDGIPDDANLTVVGADSSATGAFGGDQLGGRVASGDFNGDGFDDLLMGTEFADGVGNAKGGAGEAYVIFGSASLGGIIDLDTDGPDLRVVGPKFFAALSPVASGDVNGDAKDDLLLGAFKGPGGGSTPPGEAYVIFGSSMLSGIIDLGVDLNGDDIPDDADLTVVGAESFLGEEDALGFAVASGDFNGDNIDDFLVSAPTADGNGNAKINAGEVYVIFGSAALVGSIDLADADLTVLGVDAGDRLSGVASGDFNGDNIDDLLLSAAFAEADDAKMDAGEAYVIFGSTGLGGTIDLFATSADLTVLGARAGDQLARSIRLASGDVNGDGIDDVVLGAALSDVGGTRSNAGEAYVIFGVRSNTPPTVDAGGLYNGDEGSAIPLSGSASDDEGDPLTVTWSVNSPLCTFSSLNILNPDITCGDDGSFTATLTVDDGVNAPVTSDTTVTVSNVAPTVGTITVPADPVSINDQPILAGSVSASFSDPADTNDEPYSCTIDYDDGGGPQAGTVTGTTCTGPDQTYAEPGVYTATVTVTDKDGAPGSATATTFIVIYDPNDGFVTGGGWIDSLAGACVSGAVPGVCDNDPTGKANFGFISKYKKGASVPTGNTEFNFKAGDLNFHSDVYDWLVVNQGGTNAQYKGSGTINGDRAPNGEVFKFMIWAKDLDPGYDDTFRVYIWYEDNGSEIPVYDNGFAQAIGGGNIKIHKGN